MYLLLPWWKPCFSNNTTNNICSLLSCNGHKTVFELQHHTPVKSKTITYSQISLHFLLFLYYIILRFYSQKSQKVHFIWFSKIFIILYALLVNVCVYMHICLCLCMCVNIFVCVCVCVCTERSPIPVSSVLTLISTTLYNHFNLLLVTFFHFFLDNKCIYTFIFSIIKKIAYSMHTLLYFALTLEMYLNLSIYNFMFSILFFV